MDCKFRLLFVLGVFLAFMAGILQRPFYDMHNSRYSHKSEIWVINKDIRIPVTKVKINWTLILGLQIMVH